jgi:single-strand DNA-binding protein
MASLNQCNFIGNLGKDPEIRMTTSGKKVASFSLACSEQWKDAQGTKQEKTEWVKCVAWKQTADICERYMRKGSKVFVQGKLSTRSWDDPATGTKRYTTEIAVQSIILLDKRQEGSSQGDAGQYSAPSDDQYYGGGSNADDDLPF